MNVNCQQPDSPHKAGAQTSAQFHQNGDCCNQASDDPGVVSHTSNITSKKSRREFRWSKTARDLVRANMNATGSDVSNLISQLAEESGNPRWACRRFVRSMGIRSRRPYRV